MAMYNYGSFDGPYQDLELEHIMFSEGEGLKENMSPMNAPMDIPMEEEMVNIVWDDQGTALTSPRVDLKQRYLNIVLGIVAVIACLLVCMAVRYVARRREKPMPPLREHDAEFYGINRA